MALSIIKTLESGISVTYCRIKRFEIVRQKNNTVEAYCEVEWYLDQEARISGCRPVLIEDYGFSNHIVDEELQADYILSLLYTKLKQFSEFTGAVDV